MIKVQSFDLLLDPFLNFENEFAKAQSVIPKDANAVSLATATKLGVPNVRTVLFKGLVRGGFSFYTNYGSPKCQELEQNPKASMLFFWSSLEQQVRVDGIAEKLTRAESESYFSQRPRLSQIGSWASVQSEKIPNAEYLAAQVKIFEERFAGQDVPCPPHWGGWHILPLQIEFWFGRQGRLHDRYLFTRPTVTTSSWQSCMISP